MSTAAWSTEFASKQRVAPLDRIQAMAQSAQPAAPQRLTSKVRVAPLAEQDLRQGKAPAVTVASRSQPRAVEASPAQPAAVVPQLPEPVAVVPAVPGLVASQATPMPPQAFQLPEPPSEPLSLARSEPPPLNSSVALVLDQNTQQVLLRKNDTAVVPIASLTKMMTGLVVADARLNMDERIRITSEDVDRLKNSGSRLAVGAVITREEALHLALMSSENRAAHALARTFPGGEERFVRLMNAKAAELGMRDTRFVDPTGLSSLNRSSARDLARLATAATERPLLRNLSTSPSYEVAMGRRVVHYRNSNRLVLRDDWDIGLQKTGYIREAGRCLLMQVNVAGRQLIMVLLDAAGPAARLGDAERVRRWAETLIEDVGHDSPLSVKRRPSV